MSSFLKQFSLNPTRSLARLSDDRGSMLPIMAVILLLTTGGAALAVDVSRAYSMKASLQAAADAAALAAAFKLPDIDAAKKAAIYYTAQNLPAHENVLRSEDFEFGHWNAAGRSVESDGTAASAVRVTLRLADDRGNGLETLFGGVFGHGVMDVEASAAAGKQGVACMIALDADKEGIEVKGDAEIDLIGCGAQSNSTDKESLKVENDVRMTTGGICVSGEADIKSKADVTPTPIEFCPPHEDPMLGFETPSFGACTDNDAEYEDIQVTLTPGRVFCDGIKLKGDARVTLQPGLYVIDNGKLEVDDDAVLEGDGVTILLYGLDAEMDIKGNARLRLTAPTSGDLQGMLIVQTRASEDLGNSDYEDDFDGKSDGGKNNKWDSKEASEMTGVIYLPDGKFTSKIEANITGTDACFVLVANQIKLDGKARMSIDLSSTACRKMLPTAFSRSIALLD